MDILMMIAEEGATIALILAAWVGGILLCAAAWVVIRAVIDGVTGEERWP